MRKRLKIDDCGCQADSHDPNWHPHEWVLYYSRLRRRYVLKEALSKWRIIEAAPHRTAQMRDFIKHCDD